jgi:hypothetical protein
VPSRVFHNDCGAVTGSGGFSAKLVASWGDALRLQARHNGYLNLNLSSGSVGTGGLFV